MKLWHFSGKPRVSTASPQPTQEPDEITVTRQVAGGLSVLKSRELFEVIQTREILPRLPDDFAGKYAAHFLFSGSPYTSELREKGAGHVLVGYIGRMRTPRGGQDGELRFRTAADRIPLKEWACHWALVSPPTVPAAPVSRLIKELGRILEPGGTAVCMDWHPYSAAVREALGDRPAIDESEGIGLEKYFRAFKDAGLQATLVKESFVDGSVRKLMETDDDKDWYNEHRREPFAILLFVKKTK